ncbi:hypothetical protein E8E14_003195 [Neopestalotiopsis sp. 37M]|nr:hypothetical protein E8E14_003195 [Neopestalotiopsis sp. 37M]
MAIKTVAVVGASGLVGARVVSALQAANFEVTAVTREESKATFPANVAVRRADLSSVESLTAAFAGQDAIVSAASTVFAVIPGAQNPMIDAAVAAGVKRFIPSEYGLNTRKLQGEILGDWLQAKTSAVDYLIEKAQSNPSFTWTGIGTSLFFDWSLTRGIYGISFQDKTATIFDSGDQKISTTSLAFLAKTVAAVLQHEEETANKYIDVIEFTVSQNQVLEAIEAEMGTKFTVTHEGTDVAEKRGHEKLAQGGQYFPFVDFLIAYWFRDGPGHAIKEEDKFNKTLGMPESDLRAVVREYIQTL